METSTNKLLSDIVGRITQKGKGILAADESTNTIGKKVIININKYKYFILHKSILISDIKK
jgi:fructose-bisphosphate aldolase class 1